MTYEHHDLSFFSDDPFGLRENIDYTIVCSSRNDRIFLRPISVINEKIYKVRMKKMEGRYSLVIDTNLNNNKAFNCLVNEHKDSKPFFDIIKKISVTDSNNFRLVTYALWLDDVLASCCLGAILFNSIFISFSSYTYVKKADIDLYFHIARHLVELEIDVLDMLSDNSMTKVIKKSCTILDSNDYLKFFNNIIRTQNISREDV